MTTLDMLPELEEGVSDTLVHTSPRRTLIGSFRTWKIITVLSMLVAYSTAYLVANGLSVATPLIIRDVGYSNAQIGFVLSVSTAARLIPKLGSGLLADYAGGRTAIVFGLALIALGGFLLPWSTSLWWWAASWSLVRIGSSFPWPGIVKIASRWFDSSEIGMALSVLTLSYLFGSAVALVYLDVYVYLGFSWTFIFWIGSGTLVAILPVTMLFIRESPTSWGFEEPSSEKEEALEGAEEPDPSLREVFLSIGLSPAFWVMLALYAGLYMTNQFFLDWIPLYLVQRTGCSDTLASVGFFIYVSVGGVSALLMGFLTDRLSAEKRNWLMTAFLSCLTLVLLITAFVNQMNPQDSGLVVLDLALIGLASFFLVGPFTLPSAAISVRMGGKKVCATVSALMDGGGTLVAMCSGSLGHIADTDNGWVKVFLILSCVILASTAASVLYDHVERKSFRFASCLHTLMSPPREEGKEESHEILNIELQSII